MESESDLDDSDEDEDEGEEEGEEEPEAARKMVTCHMLVTISLHTY